MHWNIRVLRKKDPLKPLNKLSLYIAGMLCSHQCDTTPRTNTLSGTTTVGEFQNVKGNTLSHQLQANNKMILFLWNIPNPSYDTKSWVTSWHGKLDRSAQFKVMMSFNGCLNFNT